MPENPASLPEGKSLVIFDGVCNFCNASVNFILDKNDKKDIMFTANQDPAGKRILDAAGEKVRAADTVYFLENGILYIRSTAALRIAKHLRFPWNLFYGLIVIPAFIRNPIYDLIAKNRYKLFGKSETCRIPTPEEKSRFLT